VKRLAAIAIASAMLAAAASCSKCGSKDEPAATTVTEAPVPAPDGLLGDIYLGSPNGSWTRLQRGVGGATGILPATVGGLIALGFGIDPVFAGEIDGAAPAFGVVAGDPSDPGWALAVRLYDVRRARGLMVDGDTARFTARDVAGMTELVPKGGAPAAASGAGLALTRGGFLVVARSSADLARLGPYASRTLPSRPLPSEGAAVIDVPRAAVDARIRPKLEGLWAAAKHFLLETDEASRREHGGRAPDYGDPKPIVEAIDAIVSRRIAVFGDLERLRVAVDLGEEGAFLVATMTPSGPEGPAAKWIGGMRTGDAAEVLAMPAVSALALVTRDADADRDDQARELEKTLTASLGSRLADSDAKRLHGVVDDWTKARGETLGLALDWDEPRGLFFRGAVRDGEAAGRAVKGLLDLARLPPFKDALHVKDIATSSDDAPPLGKVSVATITREAPKPEKADARDASSSRARPPRDKAAKLPPSVGLAWLVDGASLDLSTGTEPVLTLRHSAKPDKKLGDEPAVLRAVAPLGNAASTIVVAQPLRFDPTRANLPTAPVVLAVGRRGRDGFVRIDLGNGMLRELSRLLL
jgi:hypothetical protein